MKKFIFLFSTLTLTVNAQIKVFSGGSVTIGSTASPATYGVNHLFLGGKIAFPSSTASFTSTPLIRCNNAYSDAGTPDYTWYGNDQTGLFHPSSNIIGITIGNSEKFRFNSTGQILSNSSLGASTPDFSWNSDPNTGIFRVTSDVLGFSTNGTERMRIRNDGLAVGTIGTSSDAKIALYGTQNKYTLQSWSDFTWDGGTNWEINVNRNATHAIMLYSSGTLKFYLEGSGDLWCKTSTTWSDKNLKENFDTIQDALGKVKKLKGYYYNFKSVYSATPVPPKEIGLIAQDVEQVVPEAVRTALDGKKGIVYDNLIALLIEAMKQQDLQIIRLQSDLNNCCTKTNESNRLNIPNNNGIDETNSGSYINQNNPNPFNKETIIEYFITERNASASVLVFDMNGKLLKTLKITNSGKGSITINANDFAPGMYYYSLVVNNKEIGTKKMILTE